MKNNLLILGVILTIAESSFSSLPFDTILFGKNGEAIKIQNLKIGDEITSIDYEGKIINDKVISFNKQSSSGESVYIQATFLQPGTKEDFKAVFLSPTHIALVGLHAFESKKAKELKRGDNVLLFNNKLSTLLSVDLVTKNGSYSPITESGRYLANGVIVSCYEDFPKHLLAHIVFSKWNEWAQVVPIVHSFFNRKYNGTSYI
jgi:Hint module